MLTSTSLISEKFKKRQTVLVKSGDVVKVHQKIREGNKERVQIFQGLVIRTSRRGSPTSRIVVRRVSSGVGVEKSFMMHSPLLLKVEVTKRSKVRRNYLTYMRQRTGKAARMTGIEFDRDKVNSIDDSEAEAEAEKLKQETAVAAEAEAQAKVAEVEKTATKAEEALAHREQVK